MLMEITGKAGINQLGPTDANETPYRRDVIGVS